MTTVRSFRQGTPVVKPVRKAVGLAWCETARLPKKGLRRLGQSATLNVVGASMKRAIPLLLGVLVIASCDDEPKKTAAVPTGPALTPAVNAKASQSAGVSGGSTICRVYVTERDVAKTALDQAPADTVLQARVTSLDALVKETC